MSTAIVYLVRLQSELRIIMCYITFMHHVVQSCGYYPEKRYAFVFAPLDGIHQGKSATESTSYRQRSLAKAPLYITVIWSQTLRCTHSLLLRLLVLFSSFHGLRFAALLRTGKARRPIHPSDPGNAYPVNLRTNQDYSVLMVVYTGPADNSIQKTEHVGALWLRSRPPPRSYVPGMWTNPRNSSGNRITLTRQQCITSYLRRMLHVYNHCV